MYTYSYTPVLPQISINIYIYVLQLTCSRSRTSAQMAACFQSIFDSNGNTQALDNSTGMQPACKASRNLQKKRGTNIRKNMKKKTGIVKCKMKIVFYAFHPFFITLFISFLTFSVRHFFCFFCLCLPKGTQTTSARHQAESGILQ